MSDSNIDSARLDDLIQMYCDKSLYEASHQELASLLASNDSAAKRYVEFVQIWSGLLDWAEVEGCQSESEVRQKIIAFPRPNPLSHWFVLSCVAATLAVVFSIGFYFGNGSQDSQLQTVPELLVASNNLLTGDSQQQYVARVVEVSSDASWGDSKPEEFLLRLARGEQLDLRTGTARIEFAAGASVILKGPALLESLAGDSVRLHRGQMTGRAKDGNFKVFTQAAEVIDLGTEFGVSVDGFSNTDVCVFDGEVDINASGKRFQNDSVGQVRLSQGMAVRVESSGRIIESFDVDRGDFQLHSTPSEISRHDGDILPLADFVAGGDGSTARVAGAIDPLSGDWDREVVSDPELVRNRYSDGLYKFSQASPYIDGVFIPSTDGLNTQLDSAGNLFNLGRNDGKTWGPIWSRMHIPNLRSASGSVSDFWGTDTLEGILDIVEQSKYGVVGMHPNIGITIDLQAVQMFIGRPLARFQSQAANLDNSAKRDPAYADHNRPSVDFSVFVDGRLEYVRGHFGRDDGFVKIDIPLRQGAKFLTLVSTDACNSYAYDHLVLIDPVLLVKPR
jgi:hypothetical protein